MAKIIAGRFDTQVQADSALGALKSAGIPEADLSSFYLTPPGQHAQYPIGGDAHHDEGTKHAGKGAGVGAAVGGAAGLAIGAAAGVATGGVALAAAAAVAATGVGGYVGSLAGGLAATRGGDPDQASREEPVERAAGIIVAVRADNGEDEVLRVLRSQGALDIERAQGEWRDGWADFDPARTPELVDSTGGPRGPAGPRG
jgi:hypothetical protein